MATNIEDRFVYTTAEQSIRDKDWAAGTHNQIEFSEFLMSADGTITYAGIKYPPSLWKMVDEAIVNAIDHTILCLTELKQDGTAYVPVSTIDVSVSPTGNIRVYNTGSGIPVVEHSVASAARGRKILIPTMIFGMLFQGSNRRKADDSIIGGTNGIGTKIIKCLSSESNVETCDGINIFQQKWTNHGETEHDPRVIPIGHAPVSMRTQHTTLSFMPDYTGQFGYESMSGETLTQFTDLLRMRVAMASAYIKFIPSIIAPLRAGSMRLPKVVIPTVSFNGQPIVYDTAAVARAMFPGARTYTCKIQPIVPPPNAKSAIHYKYPWEVCAVMLDGIDAINIPDRKYISNVNGIVVRDGKHIDKVLDGIVKHISADISTALKDANSKFSPSHVTNGVFLFVNCAIPNPSWTGQRKDVLDVDMKALSGYLPTAPFLKDMSAIMRDSILATILNKPTNKPTKNTMKSEFTKKYRPAQDKSKANAHRRNLLFCEGDSALEQVCVGVTKTIGWKYTGVMSTGGVPVNVRNFVKVINTPSGEKLVPKKKLLSNIFFGQLRDHIGLDLDATYADTAQGHKERKNLKYGHFVGVVDQDLDGKGNILCLVINMFELLWPNLLASGFIQWFETPIIQAFPKKGGSVSVFYEVRDFNSSGITKETHQIKYYKGLATHDQHSIIHAFKFFNERVYTYTYEPSERQQFEAFYGDDTDLRKESLSRPPPIPTDEQVSVWKTTRMISARDQLYYEADVFQRDNLLRKLDNAVDGQNAAGRKILYGMIHKLRGRTMKVADAAGLISEFAQYHHGEQSVFDAIKLRGTLCVGGCQLPVIRPFSLFKTRLGGKGGAARYIQCTLNEKLVDLVFPAEDSFMLSYTLVDGIQCEPDYYVPLLPLAILESVEIPSHGWKLKKWARDISSVIKNVRRLIEYGDSVPLLSMPVSAYEGTLYPWKGEFRYIRGLEHSIGRYTYYPEDNRINIWELPLRQWTISYEKWFTKNVLTKHPSMILDWYSKPDHDNVNIDVWLAPGGIDWLEARGIPQLDGVELTFGLYDRMDSHLNLTWTDLSERSFTSYSDVVKAWFPFRRDMYGKRIERRRVCLELQMEVVRNKIRYAEASHSFAGMDKKSMLSAISAFGYTPIDTAIVNNPGYLVPELIRPTATGPAASCKYLAQMRDWDKTTDAIAKYRADLIKLQSELDKLNEEALWGRFPGAKMFLEEIDSLEAVIIEGQRTGWLFEEFGKYTYD